jgi:hypothetical protein
MPNARHQRSESCQAQFHRRWHHLNDPHVRALAWLLDSPDLLDLHAPQWQGKIATLRHGGETTLHDWLTTLDRDPTQLHRSIAEKPTHRLGYYAETLMTFYFQQQGILEAHGIQVQSASDSTISTIGEFDFLLRDHDALIHWELATKFYLLASGDKASGLTDFVGPNLADTLSAKMRKIIDQQLLLGQHPAAQSYLQRQVASAQALIKGWLFYRGQPTQMEGIAPAHCHGSWCTISEWELNQGNHAIVLPRLQWMAPAKAMFADTASSESIRQTIDAHFAHERTPILIAVMERHGDEAIETGRGFIVPDNWPERAKQYLLRAAG